MNWRVLILTVILVTAAAGRYLVLHARPAWNPGPVLVRIPAALDGWRSLGDTTFEGRIEGLLGADEYVNRTYVAADGFGVSLYVGYYHQQRQGAAIHSPLNCLPGAGWQPTSLSRVPLSAASSAVVNRVIVQKGETRQIVYYWYQSRGRVEASEYWSKFYLVSDAVTSSRGDTALVRVIAPLAASDAAGAAASERARQFAATVRTSLDSLVFQ